jgi:hypothetical protein
METPEVEIEHVQKRNASPSRDGLRYDLISGFMPYQTL